MVNVLAKPSVVVALILLGLSGCAKHPLRRGRFAIFGLVTAPSGQARSAGWFVRAKPHGILSSPPAMTNRAGAFALDTALIPGRYVFSLDKGNLSVKSPVIIKRRAAWYQVVELKNNAGLGGMPLARKHISRGTVIFGLVTQADGVTPLAGAIVGAMRSSSSWAFPSSKTMTRTNKLGTFVLGKRFPPGAYAITAMRGVFDTVARSVIAITPSSGKWIVLHLRVATGSITGRILDDSGQPIAGVEVELIGNTNHMTYTSKTTDRSGRYSINSVIPDRYIVQILGRGMTERVVAIDKVRVKKNFTVDFGP